MEELINKLEMLNEKRKQIIEMQDALIDNYEKQIDILLDIVDKQDKVIKLVNEKLGTA